MTMRIHILGGGIGGMSAALHLGRMVERRALPADTEVRIYEANDRLGGKAVSQIGNWAGTGQWPGEHGFRFFPNFYRCIVDTLRYIPITAAHAERRQLKPDAVGKSVADLLVGTKTGAAALDGRVCPIRRAEALEEIPEVVSSLIDAFPVTPRDAGVFASELTRFLLTCHSRALDTWENETLQTFLAKHQFDHGMKTFLGSLRALSAMRAERGSLRTLLFTATQMLSDFDEGFALWDALLPGPTDYLMLEPWEQELERLGVAVSFRHAVTELAFAPHVQGVPATLTRVALRGATTEIVAGPDDYFVLALPYERARPLLLSAANLPSGFDGIRRIDQRADNLGDGAEPMVGIQFYLRRDVEVAAGHVVYPKAQWAMTSISQAQFWTETFTEPLEKVFGAQHLRGVLSVIVSAWDAQSTRIDKAPRHCTAEELAREAFAQVLDGIGGDLDWDADVLGYHVDSDVVFESGSAHCTTPLWVSPKGSFNGRPKADAGCENLFIASDWARTETDVGSMESADEAARWAVRGLASRAPKRPPESELPQVAPLRLWRGVEAARAVDQWLYDHQLPHPFDMPAPVRRLLARLLRGLRAGDKAIDLFDQWALVQLASGAKAVPDGQPWMHIASDGEGRAELDRVIRMLDAIDESGSPADVLERISALD